MAQKRTGNEQKDNEPPGGAPNNSRRGACKHNKITFMAWIWAHPWFSICGYLLLESLAPVPLQPTAWMLRGAIRAYQMTLSPAVPTICMFHPTCSQYGLEAVRKYGTLKGGMLATWRILRCNPFGRGGYDPLV